MNEPLTEIRFWQQVRKDQERTVVCAHAEEDGVRSWIGVAGLSHKLKVIGSELVTIGTIVIIDTHAIDAGNAAALQRELAEERRRARERLMSAASFHARYIYGAALISPKAIITATS